MSTFNSTIKPVAARTTLALAFMAATAALGPILPPDLAPIASASAASSGTEGGSGAGKKQMGRPEGKTPGSQGQQGKMGGQGSGQGGPSSDSDAKGPRYGGGSASPEPGTRGGKPVWAQEGLPEDLELGRMSVARAPAKVIDRALAEALAAIDPSLYSLPDLNAVVLAILNETYPRIDSPLENLGLYRDLVDDGVIGDNTKIVVTSDNYTLLAAIFLGSASDKLIPVTEDTVLSVTKILGLTLPPTVDTVELAAMADDVRLAILKAHEGS